MNLERGTSEYLASSVKALWPNGAPTVTRRPGRGDDNGWWILPSQGRPRMLVPVGVPGASTMLRRHDARRRDAIARRVLETAVSTRILKLLPVSRLQVRPGDGIVEHLETLLEHPVHVGVLLGSDRANRKPVLRVFSPSGETVAFLKAAHGAVGALVRGEAAALRSIADNVEIAARLELPKVLHSGAWNDLELLLLSPLAASQSRGTSENPELTAALEVARLRGVHQKPVAEFVAALRTRMAAVEGTVDLVPVSDHLDRLVERAGSRVLLAGSWHGDWSPWNIGRHQHRLQAWDWERFAEGVPVGYDAAHHRAQLLWRDGTSIADCRPALVAAVAAMLDVAGLDRSDAEHVVALYLVEILLRYLEQQPSGAPLLPRTRWVLDQLDLASSPTKAQS